jgi:3-methylcrotonyl-CoA carboxylase alpha subunit
VQTGDEISIHYDPMIAKIIVHDRTRADAIARMQRALRETVLLGLTTNITFLQALLVQPAFISGEVDTGFIDRELAALLPSAPEPPLAALIAAALTDLQTQATPAGERTDTADDNPWSRADGFRVGSR